MTDIVSRGPVTTQVLAGGKGVLLRVTLMDGEYGNNVSSLNWTPTEARQMIEDIEAALLKVAL